MNEDDAFHHFQEVLQYFMLEDKKLFLCWDKLTEGIYIEELEFRIINEHLN